MKGLLLTRCIWYGKGNELRKSNMFSRPQTLPTQILRTIEEKYMRFDQILGEVMGTEDIFYR